MKLWCLIFLTLNSAYALELEKVKRDGATIHSQKFILTNSESTFIKSSNFFDQREDYRLGTFKLDPAKAEKTYSKLKDILQRIKVVDNVLKAKGRSFNDLSLKIEGHLASYSLDGFVIKKDSDLFKEVDDLFNKLSKREWELEKGILLGKDFKKLSYIEKSKTLKTEDFNLKFHCKAPQAPTTCKLKDYGYLLIGK